MERNRKLTNMLWRHLGESVLFSLGILAVVLYFGYFYGYIRFEPPWWRLALDGATLVLAVAFLGAAYGYWYTNRLKRRLDRLYDAMLQMEKGQLTRGIPYLGEDEIGRLGEQLDRISKKWEEQVGSLQRLSANNAELAQRVRYSAVTEERQRLARELHDAVSQQLFAISMTATALGRTMDKDFDKARRQVALIEEMASVAQSEMRALLLHLRPVHLEGKRLAQGLKDLIMELRAKVPIEIQYEIDEGIELNKGIEDHLFRIVQEALSNTMRHSRADKMEIKLQHRGDYVRLYMRDNGIGFDMNEKKQASYGLATMRERVSEIGGAMELVSAPGKGTRIEIRIPIIEEESEESVDDGDAD
jgi:NarL family two-component system sensor histidine kinase LiaS